MDRERNNLLVIVLFSLFTFFYLLSFYSYSQKKTREVGPFILEDVAIEQIDNKIEIRGKVTDKKRNPLSGVDVSFVDRMGMKFTTVTTLGGYFRFIIPKKNLGEEVNLEIVLAGFATAAISLEVPWPDIPQKCETQQKLLRNGEGMKFSSGETVSKEEADIYFEGDKFYTNRGRGGIATVGNQGNRGLCSINYPECGYCDCSEIKERHVYMYVSFDENIRAEIRIKSCKKSEKVIISYHVRRD